MKIFLSSYKPSKKRLNTKVPDFLKAIDEYRTEYNKIVPTLKSYRKYKNIVLVGTGGNAIYLEPLQRFYTKNTIILDATHPELVKKILSLPKKDTLIIYMSRSGDTLEVISSYLLFKDYPGLVIASKGLLKELAEKDKMKVIPVRTDIAGRFMLATHVVGIPCFLSGLDFTKVLDACGKQKELILSDEENDAARIARFLFYHYKQGKDKIWFGAYSPSLENITFLFNQLINEGAGKEGKGPITFLRSVPRGQHELLQRIMGGANDVVSVLFTTDYPKELKIKLSDNIKKSKFSDELIYDLENISAGEIINAEAQGTVEGLRQKKRSFCQIHVNDTSLETISRLFIMLQCTAYYFCILEGVDPFSNPDVDLGKEKAREIIRSKRE